MSETDAQRWVATSVHTSQTVYHVRRDCHRLQSSNEARPVTQTEIEQKGLSECATCVGDHAYGTGTDVTVTCPHCGAACQKLGNHLPCDGGKANA